MPKTIRNPRNQWRKMKEIKNYLNKWNPYFWIGTVNIVKISIFLMWIYRFNAIFIKISSRFLVDRDKISLKFIWKDIGTTVAKTVSKEKNGGFPGVQWLRLQASNARGTGSIPDWGTKIPHGPWHGTPQKKILKEREEESGKSQSTWFQVLHSYRNRDCVILAEL